LPLAASGSEKPAASPNTMALPQPVSKGPSVTVFDEQEYKCQPGDTWESVSKQLYLGTDRFARALQRHNQNHARASDKMARTGQLAPGERIFIPQSHILEERYADAIPSPSSTSAPTTLPAKYVPPSGSSLPQPIVPQPATTPPSPPNQ
jgi:hypothetical protein